jgi:adhesin/invasin
VASAADNSGTADAVTVTAKDAAGNAVTGLPAGAFSFSYAGGSSTGSFAAATPGKTPGSYLVEFTGSTAGTPGTVSLSLDGTAISAQPKVTVKPGAVSESMSTATFESTTVASGTTVLLTVVAVDAAGNPIVGLKTSAFSLSLSGGQSTGKFGTVSAAAAPGTYTVPFTGLHAGSVSAYKVAINGVLLTAGPTVQVTPGGASAAQSTAAFAEKQVVTGNIDSITITVKDANGNAVTGLSSGDFILVLGGGSSNGTLSSVSSTTTPGVYTAIFTATAAGSAANLSVEIDGILLSKKPTVTVLT